LFLHKGFEFPQDDEWICPTPDKVSINTTTVINTSGDTTMKEKRKLYAIRHVGNAYEETEITAEFRPSTDDLVLTQIFGEKKEHEKEKEVESKSKSNKTELPFQVQITYRALSGMKCTRVITKTKEVTDDRNEVEKDIDVNVMGMHANWVAAKCAQKGDLEGAIQNNVQYEAIMRDNADQENSSRFAVWQSETSSYNNHLQRIQERVAHEKPQAQPQAQPQPGFLDSVSSFASSVGSSVSSAIGSLTSPAPNPNLGHASDVEDDETQNMIYARRNAQKNKQQWSSKRKY